MSIEEFKTLQIGMYITDTKKPKEDLVCSDFYLIQGFRDGGLILKPLWPDGNLSEEKTHFWLQYSRIELTQKLHPSEFRSTIAIG